MISIDLTSIRGRAYDLRWLAPEQPDGYRHLREVTVSDPDALDALATIIGVDVPALAAAVEELRRQRAALIALHDWDELLFGGFICLHCTPDDCDDPDDNVYWPCPSLRAIGVTDEEVVALIKARRADVERKAAQEAGAR
jgi:hypothetical protein